MAKIQLLIDDKMFKKSKLTHVEYVVLAYLRENPDIEYTMDEVFIFTVLEMKGYIRIIGEEQIIVEPKAEEIFETSNTSTAKEILEEYNNLKKEHLGVSRKTTASKYVVKFKGLLAMGFEVEYIKLVLEYIFKTWKNDRFWRNHLGSIDTIVRHFDKYATQFDINEEQDENINTML